MRNLHAGYDPRRGQPAGKNSKTNRRRNPGRAGGQSVPLHRLRKHCRGCEKRFPRAAAIMKAFVPDYEMIVPPTFGDALRILKNEPGVWKPFAGGTDLMVLFEAGKLDHKRYLSLSRFTELRGIVANSAEAI